MPDPRVDPPPQQPDAWSESVYHELHQLAARQLGGGAGHTLQPTALVHEAWIRLAKSGGDSAVERRRFFALAGKVMRSVLIDHARRRKAAKRHGGERLELTTGIAGTGAEGVDALALAEAVGELEKLDDELTRIVELVLFAGLTAAEAADVLEVSTRTVERGWRTARAFLQARLRS